MIHGFGDFDDLRQPTPSEMTVRLHQPHTFRELQEVTLLCSSQRILNKERDDRLKQITPLSNAVPIHMFFVIVVSPVEIYGADTKELHEHVKTIDASRALRHRKLMCHLEASFIALSIDSIGLTNEVN
jgi:hypothetical protein